MPDDRTLNPLPDSRLESIAQRMTKSILGKPGFINNAACRDYLLRAFRLAILQATQPDKPPNSKEIMAVPEPHRIAKEFYDKMESRIVYLASRWQDEEGLEDIRDYKTSIEQEAERQGFAGIVTIGAMITSPFGFFFHVQGKATFKIKVEEGSYHIDSVKG